MTTVTIDGEIHVHNPPASLVSQIRRKIRLVNPVYHQAINTNPRAKYALSEFIEYYVYDEETNTLTLPRGLYNRIQTYIDQTNANWKTKDNRSFYPIYQIDSSITLRDYQEGILKEPQDHPQGIYNLYTGFGKTIMALELAKRTGQRTLIITPKSNILQQFVQECEKYFGFTPGIIQGKKHEVADITVATIQTLRNRYKEMKKHLFGCLIADECHMFVPEKSRAPINHFNAYYRYGFSATPERSDGQGEAVFWIFGTQLCHAERPSNTKPEVHVHQYDGHIWKQEYHLMVEEQTNSDERNQFIANIVNNLPKDRHALVLTKRVEHYEHLYSLLTLSCARISPGVDLQAIKNELPRVLLGTYNLLSTGVDIPQLDTLVLAGDLKSSVLTKQSVGRILRKHPNKPDPIVIDIHDTNNPIFHRQALSRKRLYKEFGWETTTHSYEK